MNAILMLTHVIDDEVLGRFEALGNLPGYEKFVLLDATGKASKDLPYVREFRFPELLKAGYRPLGPRLIPGGCHFPVLEFCAAHAYEQVWCMECDVLFMGQWGAFFEAHGASQADLLTTWVERPESCLNWPWWRSFRGPGVFPREKLLRSFNPAYRVSARGAAYLRKMLLGGWVGHNEVTMPSLLHAAGMVVEDLGGYGEFVREVNRGRWYDRETFTFERFPRGQVEGLVNKLVHPVKLGEEADWTSRGQRAGVVLVQAAKLPGNRIHVSWGSTRADESDRFLVERKAGDGEWVNIHTTSGHVNEWVDVGLSPGHHYTYRVKALGEGELESEFTTMTYRILA